MGYVDRPRENKPQSYQVLPSPQSSRHDGGTVSQAITREAI
jgi:hypothetical protein